MKLKESKIENEPQIMMERVRRSSVLKNNQHSSASLDSTSDQQSNNKSNEIEINKINNQYTFSPNRDSIRRPSILKTDTIKKMHSAVELNKRIIQKSKDASLVLINIPPPPKQAAPADYNCKDYNNNELNMFFKLLINFDYYLFNFKIWLT
jgi:hypothetical protein